MVRTALMVDLYGTLVGGDDVVLAQLCDRVAASATAVTSVAEVARSLDGLFVRACDGHGEAFVGHAPSSTPVAIGLRLPSACCLLAPSDAASHRSTNSRKVGPEGRVVRVDGTWCVVACASVVLPKLAAIGRRAICSLA